MRITGSKGAAAPARPVRCALLGALLGALVSGLVAGCGGAEHASPYAAAVFDDPPVYCYRTIGDVDCYARPLVGADRRLVNYYGPPPDDYERPVPPPAPLLHPPPPGRPVPDSEAAPAPAVAPANQPTPLFPANPSPAAREGGGEDAVTATAATTAGAEDSVTAASAEKPAVASPKPRPVTAPAGPSSPQTAPLVIEVQGH